MNRIRLTRRGVFVVLCVVLALWGAGLWIERLGTPIPNLGVQAEGSFTENSATPADLGYFSDGTHDGGAPHPDPGPRHGRRWCSWNLHVKNVGRLVLGPFPAPAAFDLEVTGYPHFGQNRLYLLRLDNHETVPVSVGNVGNGWHPIRLRVPVDWVDHPVVLIAVDDEINPFGWLGVGEPYLVPPLTVGWNGLEHTVLAFAVAGLALAFATGAASAGLIKFGWVPDSLRLLAAIGVVGLEGLLVLAATYASPALGSALAGLILCASVVLVFVGMESLSAWWARDGVLPAGVALMVLTMAFYLGITLLYGADREFSDTAAHRYLTINAVDNELPQMLADHFQRGLHAGHIGFNIWQTSDRPPLQTAYDLLLAAPLQKLGIDFDTAYQGVGAWLQLLWIPAALLWLRAAGASLPAALCIVLALVPNGFFELNSMYVWPKLLPAALLLAAYVLVAERPRTGWEFRSAPFLLGALLALAFLAHSGISFAILGMALPLVVMRNRPTLWEWAIAGGSALLLVAPWTAYQHFVDPPGDHLLKWHLGGFADTDSRSFLQLLKISYGSLTFHRWLEYRWSNVQTMLAGPWRTLLWFNADEIVARRDGEYFHFFFAFGWWCLGVVPWLWAFRKPGPGADLVRSSLLWVAGTLAVWVGLMFIPNSTMNHQGAFAANLVFAAGAALALLRAGRVLFAAVSLVQAAAFAVVWTPTIAQRAGPIRADALVLTVGAALLLGFGWIRCFRAAGTAGS